MDVIERFNDAFNRHDVEAVMELMTEDVVFENTSGGRLARAKTRSAPSWLAPSS